MRVDVCVMNFGQVNISNLLNKVNFVFAFVKEHKLDVIAVSESWLVQSVSSFVALENYFTVRGDVVGLTHKHGMSLYAKEKIQFVKVTAGCPNAAVVCLIDYDLWILFVYRPPSYSVHENEVLIRVILSFCEGREVVVFGDFDLPC